MGTGRSGDFSGLKVAMVASGGTVAAHPITGITCALPPMLVIGHVFVRSILFTCWNDDSRRACGARWR